MEILRTPDSCFENLEGYPFTPNYVDINDGEGNALRMHYLDEGQADSEVILCLHGQPTWSYLYRKMIKPLTTAGYRVIAPDLVGFGKSDKPAHRENYTYARHVAWLNAFISKLEFKKITLVCQDWGGLIGLRVLAQHPDIFARVVIANTGLPDANTTPDEMAAPMRELFASIPTLPPKEMSAKMKANEMGAGFMYWIKYCDSYPDFVISDIINLSAGGKLSQSLKKAYDAPFPHEDYKQGARQFPSLVPIFPDDPAVMDNRKAWQALANFNKPFLTAFTDRDPITAGAHLRFQQTVPGAKEQDHVTIEGVGHFLQEEAGEQFAQVIVKFCKDNPIA